MKNREAVRQEVDPSEPGFGASGAVYTAFGLTIRSELPLPELRPGSGSAAVTIDFGRVGDRLLPEWPDAEGCWQVGNQTCLFWPDFGFFGVREGTEILVEPAPRATEQNLRIALLGPVLAVLLHQRGVLVQHASAVAIHGRAVAFVGDRGYGKSTMAAALYARGHQLVADDILALEVSESDAPLVFPGFPQFKLWPEAAVCCLGDEPDRLRRLMEGYEKRVRPIAERFHSAPCPLAHIYVLAGGKGPGLELLPPRVALMQLMRHSYVARYGQQLLSGERAATHLRQCAAIASGVPISKLLRENSLAALPLLAEMIEQDVVRN